MSKTTTKLQLPSPRDWRHLPVPVAITICLFALLAIAAVVGRMRSDTRAAAVPTPALVIILATAQPEPVPTAAPLQVAAVLPRFVVCYDQPVGGAVLGPIPAPDASAIVARYGTSWVMTPWNGGYCWLRAADVGLPDVADLAPTPAPQVIYQVVNVPAEAVATPTAQSYQVTSAPPATPAPVVARKEDFVLPDPKAACGIFIGCLGR